MDNAQKAIMIGVGLFVTIIIISVVLLVTNSSNKLIGDARGNLNSISKALQDEILEKYAGKTVTGAEMLNAVREYENENLSIYVLCTTPTTTTKEGVTRTSGKSFQTGNLAIHIDKMVLGTAMAGFNLKQAYFVEASTTGTSNGYYIYGKKYNNDSATYDKKTAIASNLRGPNGMWVSNSQKYDCYPVKYDNNICGLVFIMDGAVPANSGYKKISISRTGSVSYYTTT